MNQRGTEDISPKVVAFVGGFAGSTITVSLFAFFALGGSQGAAWASAISGLAGGVAGGIVAFLIARVTVERTIEPVWQQVELQSIEPLRKLRDDAAETVKYLKDLAPGVDRIVETSADVANLLDADLPTIGDRSTLFNDGEFRRAARTISEECQHFLTGIDTILNFKHTRIALRRSMHDAVGAARKLKANASLLYEARADPKANGQAFIQNTAASIRRDRIILTKKFDLALDSEAQRLEAIQKRLEPAEDRLFGA